MSQDPVRARRQSHVEAVRTAFAAALGGDIDAMGQLLDEDVRWHAAGDEGGGCQNRQQAMVWMRETLARGVEVEVLEVCALDEDRVLVLLQRNLLEGEPGGELPSPHGQIVTFRDGRVAEIIVYPTAGEAREAADAPV